MILVELFLSFFQIGLFSFGGGYAALPLIQNQVVELHAWLTQAELSDLITISQMTPGPIAINAATFVGTKLAGIAGAIVSTLGCILPSCLIVTVLAYLYLKYRHLDAIKIILRVLRPAIIILILSAGIEIIQASFFPQHTLNFPHICLFLVALFLLKYKKMNPITVMLLAGVLNFIVSVL